MAQHHHHPVQLRTNIRKLLPGELDGSTHVSHCKIEFLDETKLPNLTPVENRALRKAIIKSHFSNNAFRQIDNDSSLVIPTNFNRNQPSSINCDIILTIFEGVSKPPQSTIDIDIAHTLASTKTAPSEQGSGVFFTNDPPIQSPAFQQSRPPTGPKTKRGWRWYRTLVVPQRLNEVQWNLASEELHAAHSGTQKVQFLRICAKVNTSGLEMKKLFELSCESYIGLENCKTDGIPLQYFRQLIGQGNDSQINNFAAHILDLTQSDACLRGTKVVSNVSLSVRPIHDASLVVLERPQTSVELEKEPWTLADFVRQQFQGLPGNLHTPEQISKLSCNLRGVKVKVSVGGVHYEESVVELKSGEASHVSLQLRHFAWLARGDELEMPSLPCVNVGIPERPVLLPLELCRILPHQNLHGSFQGSMARHVESVRQHNMPLLLSDKVVSDQCFAVRGSMVIQQRAKQQSDILQIRENQFKRLAATSFPTSYSLRLETASSAATDGSIFKAPWKLSWSVLSLATRQNS